MQNLPFNGAQAMQGNPLDQLKDIHLPEPVGLWPLAWPWWLMLIALILIVVFTILYKKKSRWKKLAINQLKQLNESQSDYPLQVNRLLKQITVSTLGFKQSAPLSGLEWLTFLNNQTKTELFTGPLTALAEAPDNPNVTLDHNQLKQSCLKWIKQQPLNLFKKGGQTC